MIKTNKIVIQHQKSRFYNIVYISREFCLIVNFFLPKKSTLYMFGSNCFISSFPCSHWLWYLTMILSSCLKQCYSSWGSTSPPVNQRMNPFLPLLTFVLLLSIAIRLASESSTQYNSVTVTKHTGNEVTRSNQLLTNSCSSFFLSLFCFSIPLPFP